MTEDDKYEYQTRYFSPNAYPPRMTGDENNRMLLDEQKIHWHVLSDETFESGVRVIKMRRQKGKK